jgi:hypothetical protein
MIADMIRVVVGLAAWVAGTMIAVSVASFGANVVLRNAGASPGMPVISGVPPAQAATPPALPTVPPAPPLTAVPAKSTPAASAAASTHPPAASASPSPSPSQPAATGPSATQPPAASPTATQPATAGSLRDYTLAGGRVTLDLTQDSVQLVTAIPDAGYSVQTWSGTDWLRVDFSFGSQVSSLIASWYEHAPSVTVTN